MLDLHFTFFQSHLQAVKAMRLSAAAKVTLGLASA